MIGRLKKSKTKSWQKMHKYDIELPKMVQQAPENDERMGTTQWRDAI